MNVKKSSVNFMLNPSTGAGNLRSRSKVETVFSFNAMCYLKTY